MSRLFFRLLPKMIAAPLVLLLMLTVSAGAEPLKLGNSAGEGVIGVEVGGLEIIAIEDSPATMDIELFKGPLTREQREAALPEGFAAASVNVFVVKAPGQTILFDAGYGNGTVAGLNGQMLPRLETAGISPESVDLVVLTHMHFDHIAGLIANGEPVFPRATILVSAPELAFWQSGDLLLLDGFLKDNAELVVKLVNAYKGRVGTFEYGDKVTPANNALMITALNARGHTPGHAAFLIGSGSEQVLIVGDLLHGAQIQFPYPDENTEYDMDQGGTQLTRRAILNMAADADLPIIGMHLPWPGMGYVKKGEMRGFVFEPLQ